LLGVGFHRHVMIFVLMLLQSDCVAKDFENKQTTCSATQAFNSSRVHASRSLFVTYDAW